MSDIFNSEEVTTNKTVVRKYGKDIMAMRQRNSDGTCSIKVTISTKFGIKTMLFDNATFGDEYEQVAQRFAEALDDISCEPCLLEGEG